MHRNNRTSVKRFVLLMSRAHLLLCIVCGFLAMFFIQSPVQAQQDVFEALPPLVVLIELKDIDHAEDDLSAALTSLYPYSPLRQPLRLILGPVLRNPSLQGLPPSARVTFFLMQSASDKPVVWVAAFPILDKLEYRRILIGQPAIREEATGNDIATFQEHTLEGTVQFFLDVQAGNIALLGNDIDALKLVRANYAHLQKERMLPLPEKQFTLKMDVQKFFQINVAWLSSQFRLLRDDLVAEVAPEEQRAEHPLNVLLRDGFARLQKRLEQIKLLAVTAERRQSQWHLSAMLTPRVGSSMEYIFQQVNDHDLQCGKLLPDDCVSVNESRLWPAMWTEWVEGLGLSLASGLSGGMNVDVRKAASDLVPLLEKADPVETAMGMIAPEAGYEETGPVVLRLVRWRNPAAAEMFAESVLTALDKGPLVELLEQNGIRLNQKLEKETRNLGGFAVHTFSTQIQTGSLGLGDMDKPQRYYVTQAGEITVIATTGLRQDETAELTCLRAIKIVLDRYQGRGSVDAAADTGQKQPEIKPIFEQAVASVKSDLPGPWCSLSAMNPMQMIQSAAGVARFGLSSEELAARQLSEFSTFKTEGEPFVWTSCAHGGQMDCRFVVPEKALANLLSACLIHVGRRAAASDQTEKE